MVTRSPGIERDAALHFEKMRSAKGVGFMIVAIVSMAIVIVVTLAVASRTPPLLHHVPGAAQSP